MPPAKTKLLVPNMAGYRSDSAALSDFNTSLNMEARRASTTSSKSACAKFQWVGSPCMHRNITAAEGGDDLRGAGGWEHWNLPSPLPGIMVDSWQI